MCRVAQVPLISCLAKFDGNTTQEMMNGDTRKYVITKLPKYASRSRLTSDLGEFLLMTAGTLSP